MLAKDAAEVAAYRKEAMLDESLGRVGAAGTATAGAAEAGPVDD